MSVEPKRADDLLVETAQRVAADRFTLAELRVIRDGPRPTAVARIREHWAAFGDLGWAGLLVPVRCGGTDASWTDLGAVLEQLGRCLAISPMVECGVVATTVLLRSEADARDDLLAGIAAGATCVVLAHDESARGPGEPIRTVAERTDDGYRLRGSKRHVVFGPLADQLLVTARGDDDADTSSVFLVEREAPGVSSRDGVLIDGRPVSSVELDDVLVADGALVATGSDVDHALVAGALASSAQMIGGLQRAFEITLEYLKHREQFGAPIGAYQALQHRAAQLYCAAELSAAVVRRALCARDAADPRAPRLAHAGKAQASETYMKVAEEGVQMHGGIGMTDEAEIGFHLKAARVGELTLGDATFHRKQYATLSGY